MQFPGRHFARAWTRPSFAALAFVAVPTVVFSQVPTESPSPNTTYVQPTVTPEMGDRGGKFFGKVPDPAKTRHYYIAAEPEIWNFAPEGQDPVCGRTFPAPVLLNRASWKIRYVQYADENFSARVLPTERLGILGPVLRGTTGQYLEVTFLNRAWRPLSMHPHGVRYDKDSEGSYYKPVGDSGRRWHPARNLPTSGSSTKPAARGRTNRVPRRGSTTATPPATRRSTSA